MACRHSTPRCSPTRRFARAPAPTGCASAYRRAGGAGRWRGVVGVAGLDGLGSTEMLNPFLSNRPGDIRYGSTGKPVPGYDARIVDENGRDLDNGDVGELIIRGPSAGEGY